MKPRTKLQIWLQEVVDKKRYKQLTMSQRAFIIQDMDADKEHKKKWYNTTCKVKGREIALLWLCEKTARKQYNYYLLSARCDYNGQTAISARTRGMWYEYNKNADLEIRSNKANGYYRGETSYYYDNSDNGWPVFNSRKYINKYSTLTTCPIADHAWCENIDPHMETLAKAGERYRALMINYISNGGIPNYAWCAIRIAIKNHYVADNWYRWVELIKNLHYIGRDIHNPHYICPVNLEEAHAQALHLADIKRGVYRVQRQAYNYTGIVPTEEDAKNFIKNHKKYFGIEFTYKGLTYKVLDSIDKYKEEGEAMHHCVYKRAYYRKADSVILSCTLKGERAETIELDIKAMQILQSRAVCNNVHERHNDIVRGMESNLWRFKEARNPTKSIAV